MGAEQLTSGQKKGVRATVLVLMLVLLLFVVILAAGRPIPDIGSEPASIAYAVLVYVPALAVCIQAFRRIR